VPCAKPGPLCTSVSPAAPAPLNGVGPVAANVHLSGVAVPPSSFTTSLFNVRLGGSSSFVSVQVTSAPNPSATVPAVSMAPVHCHAPV
jgi:hypothetical protein